MMLDDALVALGDSGLHLDRVCKCVTHHNPKIAAVDVHHILPIEHGGTTTIENVIAVCPNTHRNVHLYLAHLIETGGRPHPREKAAIPPYARNLATEGYRRYVAVKIGVAIR